MEDLPEYKYWQMPKHKYHEFNGPYFKKSTAPEIEKELVELAKKIQGNQPDPVPQKRIISNEKNELLGEVSWYWKSKETNWLELGVVIFDEKNWGKGIGRRALSLWINEIFASKESIVRLGLTTWSGNEGMLHLAEKLGMRKEAQYRKARIVKGKYYDSISYGLLREEWEVALERAKEN